MYQYNEQISTLDEFYQEIYRIPPRQSRKEVTPRQVTAKILTALDNPQQKIKSVLITGSKGKGYVSIITSAILQEAYYNVGLFTSPHLFDYRERITINDEVISQSELLHYARQVFSAINQLDFDEVSFPRFFEITTAIAYLYFADKGVDFAIIETGLGARTDATNQGVQSLSVLTTIEFEHGDIFGDLAAITHEKAGVIRAKTPLVMGELDEALAQTVLAQADNAGAPVFRFKKTQISNNQGYYQQKLGRDDYFVTQSEIRAKNTWLALTVIQQLDVEIESKELLTILENIRLPARQEVISSTPLVVVDGAHTAQSAKQLRNYVDKLSKDVVGKKQLLVSFSALKNILPVVNQFADFNQLIITKVDENRSLETSVIADYLLEHEIKIQTKIIEQPYQAIQETVGKLKKDDVLVISGSVYLAGLASRLLMI